jgi:hypothetical protein
VATTRSGEFTDDIGEPVYVELADGQRVRAKRAFIKSLPTDNPFLSSNYLETLRSLPPAQRRRQMLGDWDFNDDDSVLFKLHLIQTAAAADPEGEKYAGCDSVGAENCLTAS